MPSVRQASGNLRVGYAPADVFRPAQTHDLLARNCAPCISQCYLTKVSITSLVSRARTRKCRQGLFALCTFTGFLLRTRDRLRCRFVMKPCSLTFGERRPSAGRRFQCGVDLNLNGFDLLGAGTRTCGCNKSECEHRLNAETDCENASPTW